jgi:RNA polymerase primary sigma factor
VLTLRFGLDGGKIESLSSVGKKLNIPLTGQAVRYIEARAIRKLRNPMRIKYIRNLL